MLDDFTNAIQFTCVNKEMIINRYINVSYDSQVKANWLNDKIQYHITATQHLLISPGGCQMYQALYGWQG